MFGRHLEQLRQGRPGDHREHQQFVGVEQEPDGGDDEDEEPGDGRHGAGLRDRRRGGIVRVRVGEAPGGGNPLQSAAAGATIAGAATHPLPEVAAMRALLLPVVLLALAPAARADDTKEFLDPANWEGLKPSGRSRGPS